MVIRPTAWAATGAQKTDPELWGLSTRLQPVLQGIRQRFNLVTYADGILDIYLESDTGTWWLTRVSPNKRSRAAPSTFDTRLSPCPQSVKSCARV